MAGLSLVVPTEAAGTRLDRFLATALGSRSAAQSAIAAGRVAVDGLPRPKRHALSDGELVTVAEPEPPPAPPAAEAAPFAVAYEDEHLIVVDTPAGVVV
ncbi:MAG: RluA family pseudouridine synthase, partial [Solirubrobacteraceae bacterium]